jgi:arylsulfatase A-like enzyme
MAEMSLLDAFVARVIKELQRTSQLSNTVIVFAGAHGAEYDNAITWTGAREFLSTALKFIRIVMPSTTTTTTTTTATIVACTTPPLIL